MCSPSCSFFRPQIQLRTVHQPKMRLLLKKVVFHSREKKLVQRGKHKRGDRGSSEEGNSAAKKQKMAACEVSPDNNEA